MSDWRGEPGKRLYWEQRALDAEEQVRIRDARPSDETGAWERLIETAWLEGFDEHRSDPSHWAQKTRGDVYDLARERAAALANQPEPTRGAAQETLTTLMQLGAAAPTPEGTEAVCKDCKHHESHHIAGAGCYCGCRGADRWPHIDAYAATPTPEGTEGP